LFESYFGNKQHQLRAYFKNTAISIQMLFFLRNIMFLLPKHYIFAFTKSNTKTKTFIPVKNILKTLGQSARKRSLQ